MTDEVVMWEVRAAPGRLSELLVWVTATVDPSAEIFTSGGGSGSDGDSDSDSGGDSVSGGGSGSDNDQARVVVIAEAVDVLHDPPLELIARPAHAWPFRRVRGA